MKHTKEPWKAEFHLKIEPNAKMYWVNGVTSVGTENVADVERIVACVNACTGIETEQLVKFWPNGGLVRKAELCDELIVAAKEVLRISDRKHDAWDRMKEIIAKASAI